MVIGIICFAIFILFCIIMTIGWIFFMEEQEEQNDEDQTSL